MSIRLKRTSYSISNSLLTHTEDCWLTREEPQLYLIAAPFDQVSDRKHAYSFKSLSSTNAQDITDFVCAISKCNHDSDLKSVSLQCARGKSSIVRNHLKFLSGKELLKNVTLQILNFIPVSYLGKSFLIWCNVKFSFLCCIVKCSEKSHNINIAPYGNFFYYLTYQDKI